MCEGNRWVVVDIGVHVCVEISDAVDEEQEIELVPSVPSLPLATLLYTPSTTLAAEIAEVSPLSMAIARHMGINLSPDGIAARNRRGIAVIVHGAPLSGIYSLVPFVFTLLVYITDVLMQAEVMLVGGRLCYVLIWVSLWSTSS